MCENLLILKYKKENKKIINIFRKNEKFKFLTLEETFKSKLMFTSLTFD